MSALPALVAEPVSGLEFGDGDDGPPGTDFGAMFARVLVLVARRGPFFKAAVNRAFEQVFSEAEANSE